MFRTSYRALVAALFALGLLFALTAPARAALMSYTFTGTISGSLGANNFTDTGFSWTQTGDTSAPVILVSVVPALAAISSTIQIGALPLATPTIPMFTGFYDPFDVLGFADTDALLGLYAIAAALDGYIFQPIGPLGVSLSDSFPIVTDQGLFTITEATDLVFTATAISEPASLALVVGGLVGLGFIRRRARLSRPGFCGHFSR